MNKKLKRKTESEELLDFEQKSFFFQQEEDMGKNEVFICLIFTVIAIGKTFLCFNPSIGLDYSYGIHQKMHCSNA